MPGLAIDLARERESSYLVGSMSDHDDDVHDKHRPWDLQVRVPRSLLTAAALVAFMAGGADQAQAADASPKHPGNGRAAAGHPRHVAHHRAGHPVPRHAETESLGPPLVGIASWYDDRQSGLTTASGDVFDASRLTAAHRSLPLGTRIRVTCLATGRSVIVAVNDRGPYVRGRMLDLSPAAAHALGVTPGQNLPVRIEVVRLPPLPLRTANR